MDDLNKINASLHDRIHEFIENEAKSCSMDCGCVTPLYIYRMWGGTVDIDAITFALNTVKKEYGY